MQKKLNEGLEETNFDAWIEEEERNYAERHRCLLEAGEIPRHSVLLSDAAVMHLHAFDPSLKKLGSILEETDGTTSPHEMAEYDFAEDRWMASQKFAMTVFRDALSEGKLMAYVTEPATKSYVQLPALGWLLTSGNLEVPFFQSDYVSPHDPANPGPAEATIADQRRPVFLFSESFEHWLYRSYPSAFSKKGRGRPLGSRTTTVEDEKYLQEIGSLVREGNLIWTAAKIVVGRARGEKPPQLNRGTEISVARRLVDKYKRRIGPR